MEQKGRRGVEQLLWEPGYPVEAGFFHLFREASAPSRRVALRPSYQRPLCSVMAKTISSASRRGVW